MQLTLFTSATCGAPRRASHARNTIVQPSRPAALRIAAAPAARSSSRRPAALALVVCSAAAPASFADAQALPASGPIPEVSGVYAVSDPSGACQFIGISRKINVSVATHLEALPELVGSVKVLALPDAGKEQLTEAWKAWIQEAANEIGGIPPGNAPGEKKWQQRRRSAAKPEIRLTPGKGLADLTCSVEDLVHQVVTSAKCVAFVKGTRTEPACGFSFKVLTILNEVGQDYEVCNVLDEVYNPGLRDAIKNYTQWPTIPQVFINGEFVGGSDILEQMHGSGELATLLKKQ